MNDRGILKRVPWLKLIGVALLILLLSRVDFEKFAQVIAGADLIFIALALVLNLLLIFIKTLRWQVLLAAQGIAYGLREAYLAYFGSLYVGILTPGRLGEFVKAVHVSRDCDVSIGRAFSSVLADRLFDLYALLVVGAAALARGFIREAPLIVALAFVALTAPLLFLLHPRLFGWMRGIGLKFGGLGRKLFDEEGWLMEMRAGLRQLDLPALIRSVTMTALVYGVYFGQCYLLAMALKLPADFLSTTYAVALGSLITLVPISISGLGTREAILIAYLATVSVPSEMALGFSLLVFVNFYVGGGVIGALAWWIKPVKWNPQKTAP
jgi:hypothetical protein